MKKAVLISIAIASFINIAACNMASSMNSIIAGTYYQTGIDIKIDHQLTVSYITVDLEYISEQEYDALESGKLVNVGEKNSEKRFLKINIEINGTNYQCSADGFSLNLSRYQFKFTFRDKIYYLKIDVLSDGNIAVQINDSSSISLQKDTTLFLLVDIQSGIS